MKYEDYPIVQLIKLIEQESWFQMASGKVVPDVSEQQFTSKYNPYPGPTTADLMITYKGKVLKLFLSTDADRFGQHSFYVKKDTNDTPTGRRRSRRYKGKCTKSLNKAVDIAKESLLDSIEQVEKEIAEELDILRRCTENQQMCDEFSEKLGVHAALTYPKNPNYRAMSIRLSKDFAITITPIQLKIDGFEENIFNVNIYGDYGEDSLKKIVNIITECPEVMADRLKNGK